MAAKKKEGKVEVKLNEKTTIHVRSVTDDEGNRFLDVRQFLTTEKYEGYTKKGVRIPAELVVKFATAVSKIADEF